MTERQAIAYADPSARATDTVQQKFFRVVERRGHIYSTILTVNK